MAGLFMVKHLPKVAHVNGLAAVCADVEVLMLWHVDLLASVGIDRPPGNPGAGVIGSLVFEHRPSLLLVGWLSQRPLAPLAGLGRYVGVPLTPETPLRGR
jgi:hypothetical protein